MDAEEKENPKAKNWKPDEDDKLAILDFKKAHPKLDLMMAETLYLWNKHYPEEVEMYRKGTLELPKLERDKGGEYKGMIEVLPIENDVPEPLPYPLKDDLLIGNN